MSLVESVRRAMAKHKGPMPMAPWRMVGGMQRTKMHHVVTDRGNKENNHDEAGNQLRGVTVLEVEHAGAEGMNKRRAIGEELALTEKVNVMEATEKESKAQLVGEPMGEELEHGASRASIVIKEIERERGEGEVLSTADGEGMSEWWIYEPLLVGVHPSPGEDSPADPIQLEVGIFMATEGRGGVDKVSMLQAHMAAENIMEKGGRMPAVKVPCAHGGTTSITLNEGGAEVLGVTDNDGLEELKIGNPTAQTLEQLNDARKTVHTKEDEGGVRDLAVLPLQNASIAGEELYGAPN